jgi:hypothetical protein
MRQSPPVPALGTASAMPVVRPSLGFPREAQHMADTAREVTVAGRWRPRRGQDRSGTRWNPPDRDGRDQPAMSPGGASIDAV